MLIELGELLGFDYDLSDTQDGLMCWRIGIYILWLTSSHGNKDSGERSRALFSLSNISFGSVKEGNVHLHIQNI